MPFLSLVMVTHLVWLEPPCQSGPQAGDKYGPYAFLIATGARRGTDYCYVCETADKPAVIVFARRMSDPLGKLLVQLDAAVTAKRIPDLAGWVTFLAPDQPTLEPKLLAWSRKLGLKTLPVGIYEDEDGPPRYQLSRDADLTVLLVKNGKVRVNFAFRPDELTPSRIDEVVKRLSDLAS